MLIIFIETDKREHYVKICVYLAPMPLSLLWELTIVYSSAIFVLFTIHIQRAVYPHGKLIEELTVFLG